MARILIVEDEPLISMMLEAWLADLGHEPVGPVTTVVAALESLTQPDFAAAILDVNLRGERSDQVADALAKLNIPFVVASGDSADAIAPRFADRPYLRKPYGFAALHLAVQALTGGESPA